MEKDLIIDVNSTEISIALLDNHRLVELNKEQNNGSYSVGDVYLGKVKKIMPALNAAFVDIGDDKDAFIHYLDLGFNFRAFDYFTKAYTKGSKISSYYLAISYLRGLGTEVNYKEAFNYLLVATDLGYYSDAFTELAKCYIEARGCKQDIEKGIEYYKKGVEAGSRFSAANLGYLYYDGKYIEKNYARP